MLPQAHRLSKQKDFDGVWERGRTAQDDYLKIRLVANHQKQTRFGLIIAVKTAKQATVRNRLRRQLNSALRLRLKKIKPGQDVVLTVKSKLVGASYQELEVGLDRLLNKAKLYD